MKQSLEKKNEQLEQSAQINEQLQKTSDQAEFTHKREMADKDQHMNLVKQEYFFAMALAVKLTMVSEDQCFFNKSIQPLWERVNERHLPISEWKNFATEAFTKESEN